MAIRCLACKREYDATLFEFGREIVCDCGKKLSLKHEEIFGQLDDIVRQYDLEIEEENLSQIKRASERIAFLIVATDVPKVDIEIEMHALKELIEKLFPDKAHLYEMIYETRFHRLFEQFRSGSGQ